MNVLRESKTNKPGWFSDDDGSVTIMAVGIILMLLFVTSLFISAAAVFVAHTRAQTAADMAAIAGAYALNSGHVPQGIAGSDPCAVSFEVAKRNGFTVSECSQQDSDIRVQLADHKMFFGAVNVRARARAGLAIDEVKP